MIGTVAFEKISAEDFQWLKNWIKDNTAIVMDDGRKFVAEKRLHSLLWKHKIPTFKELCKYLKVGLDAGLKADALEAITANDTWFFRDPHYFDLLKTQIIPHLMRTRQSSRKLRIWSAGCSTGQEAYSLAILLDTMPLLEGWDVQLMASDLSSRQIERAKQGVYSREEVNRGLPAVHLTKYFQQEGMAWAARESLKEKIQFNVIRLDEAWSPMPTFDLVLLRNVLIYFDEASRLDLLWRMRKQISVDGSLVLGSAEQNDLNDGFELAGHEKARYYQRIQGIVTAKAA